MAPILPPTSLPPLRRLSEYSAAQITWNIRNISQLYWPPLPSALTVPRRKKIYGVGKPADSGYASAVGSDDEEGDDAEEPQSDSSDSVDELRADPFERAFAKKWLTGLIGRVDSIPIDDHTIDPEEARDLILEEATALLARFAHSEDDPEYDVTRSFAFPLQSGEIFRIELNDGPVIKSDHTSVGLQSWASAIIMAEQICADPAAFDLVPEFQGRPLRVLELGAGTGLLAIAAAKVLPAATVIATDYHPAILTNLALNIRTLFPSDQDSGRVFAHELDWAKPSTDPPFDVPFDVLLAADVVYHADHARLIHECVARTLRKPSGSDPGGVFHMKIAVRTTGRHEGLHTTVDDVFESAAAHGDLRLAIVDKAAQSRQGTGLGRADESGYRTFKICWVRT